MKQLLFFLIILPLFVACSSDEDEPTQDYTSFVVTIDATPTFPNCVAAYQKDNKFYKLGDLGDLTKGKYSTEIRINDNSITEIYVFSDYLNVIRFDAIYRLEKNKKNTIVVAYGTGGIRVTNKSDPTQYPQ